MEGGVDYFAYFIDVGCLGLKCSSVDGGYHGVLMWWGCWRLTHCWVTMVLFAMIVVMGR